MAAQPPTMPRLRIDKLKIEAFRSLRQVNWPEDGMGWGGKVPDIVVVGGANGSGKTTLLELLFGVVKFAICGGDFGTTKPDALTLLPRGGRRVVLSLATCETTIDLTISSGPRPATATPPPSRPNREGSVDPEMQSQVWTIWVPESEGTESPRFDRHKLYEGRTNLHNQYAHPESPKLLYFPTDRAVTFPETRYKGPGNRNIGDEPTFRYEVPKEWIQSIEAILYDARWRDLNAKERGNAGSAKNFAAFEATMHRFFGDTKRFHWDDDGVLHIQTRDGALHSLDALSSGEKQVLLFGAELYRRWTPGSLVLLDEPELHLHEAWLAALWGFLNDLQRERGGQVILATQSNYLFGLGGSGSRVILGRAP